jgi:TPR repeat protein
MAAPGAVLTVGSLPALPTQRALLGQANLQQIAQIAHGASLMRDCSAGNGAACGEVMRSGRPEDHAAAKTQLRALVAKGCDGNDGKACDDLANMIEADGGSPSDRDTARTKACNLNVAHACFVLAAALAGNPATASAGQPLFAKACTGGEGQACEALAVMYEAGTGVPKDAARARTLHTQACTSGVAAACVAAGNRQAACTLGDQTACNVLCRAGNATACNGASPELKQIAEDTARKHDAEIALPTLMAKCATDRATIQRWKDSLAAAQRAGNVGQAEQSSAKLEELQQPWETLKIDLQTAIVTVTGGYGSRFESLRRQARMQCVGHE